MNKTATPNTTKLTYKRNVTELPVFKGTRGPAVIDIGTVYRDTGCFTFDPGFTSTASCSSRITFLMVRPANSFTAAIRSISLLQSPTSLLSASYFLMANCRQTRSFEIFGRQSRIIQC